MENLESKLISNVVVHIIAINKSAFDLYLMVGLASQDKSLCVLFTLNNLQARIETRIMVMKVCIQKQKHIKTICRGITQHQTWIKTQSMLRKQIKKSWIYKKQRSYKISLKKAAILKLLILNLRNKKVKIRLFRLIREFLNREQVMSFMWIKLSKFKVECQDRWE